MNQMKFPNLLYISDVPVYNNNTGGALVIYRLLHNYPGKITIVNSNIYSDVVNLEGSLPGVKYYDISYPLKRLYKTRFTKSYNSLLLINNKYFKKRLNNIIDSIKPDVILSVSHHLLYLTAFECAKDKKIPFYCIHHDYYLHTLNVFPFAKKILTKKFKKLYTVSTQNLCVSPYLKEQYDTEFKHSNSTVLYPLQAEQHNYKPPLFKNKINLSFAYVGSINTQGLLKDIIKFAHLISINGHRLHLFGGTSLNFLKLNGLETDNVVVEPWIKAENLMQYLQQNIDVLLLIQDSTDYFKLSVSLNFPSKLVDYTQTGLPTVIIGKPYASGVKLTIEEKEAFLTINNITEEQIDVTLDFLSVTKNRRKFGENAKKFGDANFANKLIRAQFYNLLKGD